MLVQTTVFDDSLAVGIGIREVGLHQFRTGTQREGVDGRYARLEEVLGIVGAAIDFIAPAGSYASVGVLEIGNAISSVFPSGVRAESDIGTSHFSFLGGDYNHTIGSGATVQSGSSRTFQDIHAFDVVRVQIGDTIATVTVSGIVVTTEGSGSSVIGRAVDGHTVYHVQRLVAARYGTGTTDNHLHGTAQTRRTAVDLYTGSLTGQ